MTGIFLAIELASPAVLTLLGIINIHADRVANLFTAPVVGDATTGALDPVALGVDPDRDRVRGVRLQRVLDAVNLAEEIKGSSRHIATAILWSLVITVAAELIPTTAVLLGAPDLVAVTASSTPMRLPQVTANSTLDTFVSLGIALAIFNA